ncbi:MAG TPA: ABC transporter ATP-binding protein [Stellaceae bacterium]|nr:ABC transporter ATP-binding protein [Stellaceae bacterium]
MSEAPAHLRRPAAFLLYLGRRRLALFLSVFALVIGAALCAVAVQYGMKLLVDAMAGGPKIVAGAETALALFIGLIVVENALWRLAGWLGCRAVVATGVDIRLELFRHLTGHPMRYFSNQFSGALGHRVTATAGAVGALIGTFIWNIIPPCTDFLGALVIFTTVDWRMAGVLCLFVALVAGGLVWLGARGRPLHQRYAEQANLVSGELVDVVANIWAVKAFSARAREQARLKAKFGIEAAAQRRSWMYLEKMRVLHDIALTAMAGSMLIWAVHLWMEGRISPGDVVVVSALTFRILHGSRDLALALIGTTQHLNQIAEALRVIGRPHEVTDRARARSLVPLGGAVEFDRVSFAYPGGRRVFHDFSLRIPAGQHVGIVGPSGAGKSTLVGLVQRLHDVAGGAIRIDHQPITEVTQDSLRAAIAVVPQEITLFNRSVIENIRYGRPEADDSEVYAAARGAYCDDFIRALPAGYATMVGERGVKLSGGQRQRLGIARAILKDAPIIILDEATSALDTESEREIQRALEELIRGRTVLAIAHRLSTLVLFDRILVVMDGKVVEDGAPAELRRRGGIFDQLWRMQAEGLSMDEAVERAMEEAAVARRGAVGNGRPRGALR